MSLDVLTIGESLGLTVANEIGAPMRGDQLTLTFGGAESNVAIGVARLGGAAAWVGRLGNDALGDLIVRELRGEGVSVFAARDDAALTSLMMKSRPRPGATSVSFYRRGFAGSRLSAADLPVDAIRGANILHITGISAALAESSRAALHAAIDIARDAGVTVSFDVNHRASLLPDATEAREIYRALAERADIIFAGDDEAEILTGEREHEAQLHALLALGAQTAVVKLGADGALAGTNAGTVVRVAALTVDAVDTVGAGDAFVAGFLTETARGLTLAECLETATATGAYACLAHGDWEAAPTRRDLAAFLATGDPVSR
ncbi:sugar kinase [Microbacterium sp. NC79]|uniref:sugar kinase n=1 Tax=Microbacterium sp. NC79 TaxID=2851009 RepID=UPI001C2C260F|nr:sugar kinase [Microbacterium sp. NC79]MBV0895924.1 sugar kinase [Microbacterium sp. NC79]